MLFQGKGVSNSNINTYPVPTQFLPNAPYNAANTSCGIPQKYVPQTKSMWLIAFAGELGDVVSRPLPHGILGTSEDTHAGDFRQKSGLVCVQVCRGSLRSPVSSGAYQLNPPKM